MAVRLTVDFNSGTNGSTITAAGNIAAVTGTPTYTTDAMHGGMGMGVGVAAATNASTFIQVTLGANPVSHSGSIYYRPKTQSASFTNVIRFADSSNNPVFTFAQTTTKFTLLNEAGTTVATSVLTWADQWYRWDWQVDLSTPTAPVMTWRIFATPESDTPTETLTQTMTATRTFARWLIGAVGIGGSSSTRSSRIDTFRVADGAEWIGSFIAVTGTLARTEAADTSSAAGQLGYSGASARTEAADTSSASGQLGYSGASARTQAPNTSTASGSVAAAGFTGTGSATQAGQTASASGKLGYASTATPSQAAQTAAAAGKLGYAGASTAVAASQTSGGVGVLGYAGTAAGVQDPQTASVQGQFLEPVAGTVAASQQDQTSASSGVSFSRTTSRPDTGPVARPDEGTSVRMDLAPTVRPSAGTTARPFAGTITR